MFPKQCSICFEPAKIVHNIIEVDSNSVSYFTKLQFAIPEIQWEPSHCICLACVQQLRLVYTFKELCFKSFNILKSIGLDNVDNNFKRSDNLFKIESDTGTAVVSGSDQIDLNLVLLPSNLDGEKAKAETGIGEKVIDNYDDTDGADAAYESSNDDFPLSGESKQQIESKHTCAICNKSYKTSALLKSHSTTAHTDKSKWEFECFGCEKIFARKSSLVSHVKYKHLEQGTFICHQCGQTFNHKHELVFHQRDTHPSPEDKERVTKRKHFECEVCRLVFLVRKQLYRHAKEIHDLDKSQLKPYKCDQCEKRFKVSTYLASHKLYHEGKRTKMCNVCGKGFITLKDLRVHETYHTNNFVHTCPFCERVFKNHKLLYAHKVSKHVAPENWKFCCTICGKRFPRVSGYKMHVKRHLGDKQFGCHLCESKFVSKFQLLRHVESHSNVKRFHCEYCGKDYREKRIFNIHLLDVHGIGTPTLEQKLCHICSMSFSCNYKLRRHILKHSKPYACTLCDKKYPDNYHLKLHLKNKHKVENYETNDCNPVFKEEMQMM